MFCIRVAWMCLVCLLLCKEEDSSPVFFVIKERRDMSLYSVPLLGFWMGTMLATAICVVLCWCSEQFSTCP